MATDEGDVVVDGLGVLPPFPVNAPRPMIRGLRKRKMAWLLRLLSPEQIEELMSKPLPQRRRALRDLRALYQRRKASVEGQSGRRFRGHRMVQAHPLRRPGGPRGHRGPMPLRRPGLRDAVAHGVA